MEGVTIYTLPNCPYCVQAKDLLTKRGVEYKEVPVDRNDIDTINAIKEKNGMKTFPQIFNGDTLIGGYSELSKVDQDDQLAFMKN